MVCVTGSLCGVSGHACAASPQEKLFHTTNSQYPHKKLNTTTSCNPSIGVKLTGHLAQMADKLWFGERPFLKSDSKGGRHLMSCSGICVEPTHPYAHTVTYTGRERGTTTQNNEHLKQTFIIRMSKGLAFVGGGGFTEERHYNEG